MLLANAASPLLKNWTPLIRKKFEIVLISIRDKSQYIPKDIKYRKISSKLGTVFSYIKLIFQIRKLIKKYKPDILISHYVTTYGIIAHLSGFKPHIAVPYGSDVYQSPFFMDAFIKKVLKKAQQIIVSTKATKEFLMKKFDLNNNKFLVKSWGIDKNIFNLERRTKKKGKTNIFEEFLLSFSEKYILSPRCLKSVYNQEVVLEAFSLIQTKHSNYKLIMLYCTNNRNKRIEKHDILINNLNVKENVIWISRVVNEDEMADLMSISEIIFNVPKTDQLASTLLEAIACGCFPLVSKLKPYEEVLLDGVNSLYVENNSISIMRSFEEYILKQQIFQLELEKNSIRIMESYSIESFVNELEQVFNNYEKRIAE